MEQFTSLSQLINENKESLRKELRTCVLPTDTDKVKQLCVKFITRIAGKDAEYMAQLSLLEQDIMSPVFKIIDVMGNTGIAIDRKSVSAASEERQTAKKGQTIGKVLGKVLPKRAERLTAATGYKLTDKDIDLLVDSLSAIGGSIDKLLLTYRNHIAILQQEHDHLMDACTLDGKYKGVLKCLQTVLGSLQAMDASEEVKDIMKQVNRTLQAQGYNAVHYSSGTEEYFDAKEGDVNSPEEFNPAIVKVSDGRESLVINGDVLLPGKEHS